MSRRRRRWVFRIAIPLAGLIASDLVLGLLLAARGWRRDGTPPGSVLTGPAMIVPHERWLWDYRPDCAFTMRGEGVEVSDRTNGDGLRDRERPRAKPAGTRRILAVGDSFTFGWLVTQEETWWSRLASALSARQGSAVECLNLGQWMATYDQQALRALGKGLAYQPDEVIQLVYPPHLRTILSHEQELDAAGHLTSLRDPFVSVHQGRLVFGSAGQGGWVPVERRLSWPATLAWVRYRRARAAFLAAAPRLAAVSYEELLTADTAAPYQPAWALAERAVATLADACRQAGIPYRVVLIPQDLQVSRAEWNGRAGREEWLTGRYPQEQLEALCRRLGVPCLDLLPSFRAQAAEPLYFAADPHWTPAGHALAAREIEAAFYPR